MTTIWKNIPKLNFKSINEDLETDVLIIGGGLAGVMTAYYLNNSNLKITLAEMNEIGNGSSAYTTGKLTIFQSDIYNEISKNYNFNKATAYLNSQIYGLNLVLENIKSNNISCDLEKTNSFIFTDNENNKTKIKQLKSFFDKNNIETQLTNELPNNFPCKYAIKGNGYVFNPLKYLYKITEKCNADIYEHSTINNIKKIKNYYVADCNNKQIKAKIIVVATQYPFFIIPGLLPFKLSTYKSYALSAPMRNLKFDAISIDYPYYSIRYHKNNIIFGGNSHKTFTKIDYQKNLKKIEKDFTYFFNSNPKYKWMTSDVKTNDILPFIGQVKDNVYIITGFNKWGMINSTLAGKIISDLITNTPNKFEKLFVTNQKLSKIKIKNEFINSCLILKRYITEKIIKNKKFYNKSKIIKINGINYGIYIDKKGNKHTVLNKCPHMGCSLIFNNEDLTWDCPCHASKFDIHGNCIKGPSNKNIKIKTL